MDGQISWVNSHKNISIKRFRALESVTLSENVPLWTWNLEPLLVHDFKEILNCSGIDWSPTSNVNKRLVGYFVLVCSRIG